MKVKRIVSNVAASDVEKASAFYKEVLGLKVLMDLGWIRTFGLAARGRSPFFTRRTESVRSCDSGSQTVAA